MDRDEAARVALERIRQSLVRPAGLPLEELTAAVVWRWRNDLYSLAYFSRATLGGPVTAQVETLVTTSGSLWRLLNEHADALAEIADYRSARALGAGSDLVGVGEEFLTGEDNSLRDVLANALAVFLNWKSNTAFVAAGEKAHRARARSYLPEIQDEIWEFLRVSSDAPADEMTMERAQNVGGKAEEIVGLISAADMPTDIQVLLLAFLYQWILRLRMGRLLIALEEMA
ncbi:hypothetical protein CMK11_15655 [Candidatus Poribacteria bacterium]|nr:hypothetical protein [Candidatus Poribacteria bacterium]